MHKSFSEDKVISEESLRKVFEKVFNERTMRCLYSLASKGYFQSLEFQVNDGKEAHVFRAVDASGTFRAVKIYKVETAEFNAMAQYIEGDRRFMRVKKDRRSIVFTWAKKEFRNLQLLSDAKADVPYPTAVKENVLVMEFIGKDGIAAKSVKEAPPKSIESFREAMVEFMAKAYSKGLVHSDLSEYNVLNNDEKFVVIDVGQGVLTSHPMAGEFFRRDVENIAGYISNCGEKVSAEDLTEEVRRRAKSLG
ncbi:MAG: serine protein kinase RIO [Candidatus Diapherotrites archaeon]|nr:serine protein kinase RIO [Candidatus Diapherotrites archaeon]